MHPDGQIQTYTDAVANTTTKSPTQRYEYSLIAQKRHFFDAKKTRTEFTYDAAGYLKEGNP